MIKNLGYRIILIYCNRFEEYRPLYELSINLGFIPIAKLIESSEKLVDNISFFTEFNAAYIENFHDNSIYKSEQQYEMYEFFEKNNHSTISIIAPTSYGKTELIISLLKKNKNKRICIVTPTKSLLAQTKMRILGANIDWVKKVVIQPEMFNEKEDNLVAVLTQERLLRLLKLYPDLSFDYAIIDEAHGLLHDDERSRLLASVVIILNKRNNKIAFKFLTPFLCDSNNLKIKYADKEISTYKVEEYIKSEKLYIYYEQYDKKKLKLYDQFLDRFYTIGMYFYNDLDFIKNNCGSNNIIYLNKPKDIENFALRLSKKFDDITSERINKACESLKDFIHPQYDLLNCLKKGIIYHHGSVPDSVRIYIENLFSNISEIKYIITSSTLLEGVNLPADKLFILDNRKGMGYLSPSNFKNLIGRINRFSEIFTGTEINLKKLEPEIYILVSKYFRKNSKVEEFLSNSMKVEKIIKDDVKNVLLQKTILKNDDKIELKKSKEFIENYEVGTITNYKERRVNTDIGKSCFANNITEIDIFQSEYIMQKHIDKLLAMQISINDTGELFNILKIVFFNYIIENGNNENLLRFKFEETRNFYKMFLDWRIKGASYNEMISQFIKHWDRIIIEGRDTLVYVGHWGDEKRQGHRKLWTDILLKTKNQKINLAIVRIKEEQDFLDNIIIKFIEVLHDMTLLDEILYLKIKYGTSDKLIILLVKNGLSLSLAKLISDKYSRYLITEYEKNTIKYKPELIDSMRDNYENEVLIYEMSYFCEKC
jgi:hypothetical protein